MKGKKVAVGIWKDGALDNGKTITEKIFKINGILVGRKRVIYWKNKAKKLQKIINIQNLRK